MWFVFICQAAYLIVQLEGIYIFALPTTYIPGSFHLSLFIQHALALRNYFRIRVFSRSVYLSMFGNFSGIGKDFAKVLV